jgi:hypothetical protein
VCICLLIGVYHPCVYHPPYPLGITLRVILTLGAPGITRRVGGDELTEGLPMSGIPEECYA